MYQVLYRKWRPVRFSEVVGQGGVTATLQNELKAGRVSHAYLFTGSRGTGKTTCAKILAKAVNCLRPENGDPCGECEICRGIEGGSVLDVVEIDAASNNGVDNIRMLREEANFTPNAAKYRVYIIDEVHMLSISAFNALLKTLEEPPAHVIFILATTEVHKLPATILSRCQRFDFRRIAPDDIAGRLRFVAAEEGAGLSPEAALLIARLADGALRDALSILDQCLGVTAEVTEETVRKTVGLVGRDHLFSLADAVFRQDAAAVLETVDSLYRGSMDMTRLCEELIGHFRALMLIKTVKKPADLLAVTEEELGLLEKQSSETALSTLLSCLDALQETLERMGRGGDRRSVLEMTLLRLCSPSVSREALVKRVEALEKKLAGMAVSAPAPAAPAPSGTAAAPASPAALPKRGPAEAPAPPPAPDGPEPPPAEPEPTVPGEERPAPPAAPANPQALTQRAEKLRQWPEILQILKGYSQSIASAFSGSSAYVSGDYVLIDAPQAIAFELLRKSSQRDKMRDAIRQVTGRVYKLGPYKKPEAEKQQEDPLAAFAEMARQAGIPVKEEQEE